MNAARVYFNTTHVHGPHRISLGDGQCALVSMMKDAEYFIDEFVRHHQKLGVRHILIIDNGSTDTTILKASAYENVTIVKNTLPPRRYESRLRREIARRHIKGGWLLFMDSDELFDFPSAHPRALDLSLDYCNRNGYTGVLCQCLDFFSNLPLSQTAEIPYAASLDIFKMYSLGDIEKVSFNSPLHRFGYYTSRSRCRSEEMSLNFGGIRRSVFGEQCLLTAHRLVRNLDHIGVYAHPHFSINLDIADFTALIRHYKFCGNVFEREARQVSQQVWGHGEDRARVEKISENGDLLLFAEDQRFFSGPDDLVDQEFLVMSEGLRSLLTSTQDADLG